MNEWIDIKTPAHQAMVPLTRHVAAKLDTMDLTNGLVHLFVQHTTCGLTINENADPDVTKDLIRRLESLVPWDDPQDQHAEGNTAAHLRSQLTGISLSIPVVDGKMQLGIWQGIYLCEFDGPRNRRVIMTTTKSD